MKTTHLIMATLLTMGLMTGAAQAQTIDQRHYHQQRRINDGLRNGSLTPHEARRVEAQQRSIHRQEARMRYRHGGSLSGYDRALLQHREDRASRHIYDAKHNGRRW
ncbi:hypothetical protein [Sphingomonas sp. TREG-RG-20F-R18-01]|uniref:hypothetical protein n=1 Tax=Sphingomonas sp. TREG-RG-20F-R18-01 TaxID=2914982 RepID=UPI001F57398D|nr:hypothetical protein [Sphingomonas sp. TREG-RG-20F-R18-01]